jgi:hypothetical protein
MNNTIEQFCCDTEQSSTHCPYADSAGVFAVATRRASATAPARGLHGNVRANFRPCPAVVTSGHERPIPIFQQLARSDRMVVMMYVSTRCRCATSRISWPSAGSISAMIRSSFGGTSLARCSPPRSGRSGSRTSLTRHRARQRIGARQGRPPSCSSIAEAVRRKRKPSSLKSAWPAAVPMLSPLISLRQTVHTASPSRPVHRGRHRAPLAGKLFDDRGNRMSRSPRKGSKRWRY